MKIPVKSEFFREIGKVKFPLFFWLFGIRGVAESGWLVKLDSIRRVNPPSVTLFLLTSSAYWVV